MYQIKCDDYILYDHRDPSLIVENPKVKIAVNTVGESSFAIYQSHPFYGHLKVLKSIFEISDEIGVIFRGRMTENSHDFYNTKAVDLEGLMAFFNDSVVAPFNFPEDFIENEDYISAAKNGNVVEFFLNWLIENHNSQVEDFQKFKLGTVTVSDPNNYITRSESKFPKTWEVLKSKLFESNLGGYLCIRYEADGNYIDYLSEFTLTNTQEITFGENLLDLQSDIDASETYSAIIPIGAEIEEETETTNDEGETITETTKRTITLDSIEDGDITDDIVKIALSNGLSAIYSKSAVEKYGWKCAPVDETTWEDVTETQNLLNKSIDYMTHKAPMLSNPSEFSAADLHFSDAEIQSFRLYRNVRVNSTVHNQSGHFPLISLEIELFNPQDTKITVGEARQTLTDYNSQQQSSTIQRIEKTEKDISENRTSVSEVKNQVITQSTQIINSAEEIILSALENYVESGDYEEFRNTVEAQLKLVNDEFEIKISDLTEQISNIDGDLQSKFQEISSVFTFNVNGFTIGKTNSPYKIFIDDNEFTMTVNDERVLWFEITENGNEANIPEVTVTKRFTLFGYLIDQDENGNVNCEYIGGAE